MSGRQWTFIIYHCLFIRQFHLFSSYVNIHARIVTVIPNWSATRCWRRWRRQHWRDHRRFAWRTRRGPHPHRVHHLHDPSQESTARRNDFRRSSPCPHPIFHRTCRHVVCPRPVVEYGGIIAGRYAPVHQLHVVRYETELECRVRRSDHRRLLYIYAHSRAVSSGSVPATRWSYFVWVVAWRAQCKLELSRCAATISICGRWYEFGVSTTEQHTGDDVQSARISFRGAGCRPSGYAGAVWGEFVCSKRAGNRTHG